MANEGEIAAPEVEPDLLAEGEARLLAAARELAPAQGWTAAMARAAGAAAGFSAGETELLIPGGARDLAALHSRAIDTAAMVTLAGVSPAALKVRERIRQGAWSWIEAAVVEEAATRRWTGFLALPRNAALGLRLAWESADKQWIWAGDTATDANHYSKRALLAGILIATLLVRLSQGEDAARATLDARIEAVMTFERLKAHIGRLELGRQAAGALGRLRYGRI
jgi:ubiquinone biosynthesis protein COQ9